MLRPDPASLGAVPHETGGDPRPTQAGEHRCCHNFGDQRRLRREICDVLADGFYRPRSSRGGADADRIERTPLPVAGPNAAPVEEPPVLTPTKTATATPTAKTTDCAILETRGDDSGFYASASILFASHSQYDASDCARAFNCGRHTQALDTSPVFTRPTVADCRSLRLRAIAHYFLRVLCLAGYGEESVTLR